MGWRRVRPHAEIGAAAEGPNSRLIDSEVIAGLFGPLPVEELHFANAWSVGGRDSQSANSRASLGVWDGLTLTDQDGNPLPRNPNLVLSGYSSAASSMSDRNITVKDFSASSVQISAIAVASLPYVSANQRILLTVSQTLQAGHTVPLLQLNQFQASINVDLIPTGKVLASYVAHNSEGSSGPLVTDLTAFAGQAIRIDLANSIDVFGPRFG